MVSIDQSIYNIVSSWRNPYWLKFNQMITLFGDWRFLLIAGGVVLLLLILRKRYALALWFYPSFSLAMAFNALLKTIFTRIRPHPFVDEVITTYSFPSGHTIGSLVFFGLYSFVIIELRVPGGKYIQLACFVLAVLVAASRVFLGVHWFTDVVAGLILGITWIQLCLMGARRLRIMNGKI